MSGAVPIVSANFPARTGHYTDGPFGFSIYPQAYYAAKSICKGGSPVSDFSNVVGKTFFPQDSFETYTNGAALTGLNGGASWSGAYAARTPYIDVYQYDSMESYTNGAAVNGLNAGTGWAGAFVAR